MLETDTWTSSQSGDRRTSDEERGSNIILLGGMGSGKSTIGWHLARLLGYGFVDTDKELESIFKKPISQVFDQDGEEAFRSRERDLIQKLAGIRSHVISVGGGTVVDDQNWVILDRMGVSVWLNPPAEEVARRFLAQDGEIVKRPLLADLMNHKDKETRQKLLTERLSAIIGNRADRYREARLQVCDSFCTPESTTLLIRDLLLKDRLLSPARGEKPLDRWGIF